MSIDTGCGIMLGLPYDEMCALVGKRIIDEMIYEDVLQVGSIFYDSAHTYNVIGVWIEYVCNNGYKKIDNFSQSYLDAKQKLPEELHDLELNTYLTNHVT
jgi:hypothetical protein